MPIMGAPERANNYGNIAMAEKPAAKAPTPLDKKDFLNQLAGAESPEKITFKDAKKHNQIGKDEFMKLLSHQMQNQDPMNPMEQNKFVSELAQFAQLEQVTNLNSKFEAMAQNSKMESKFMAASFLGKNVMTTGTTLSLKKDGAPADVFYKLNQPAEKVLVRVFDKKNNMMGEIIQDNVGRGSHTATWDGVNLDGTPATRGDYTVQIFAYDKNFKQISVESKVSGTVTGVNFDDGETVLTVDGDRKVYLRDVESFALNNESGAKVQAALPSGLQRNSAVLPSQAMNAYEKQKPVAAPSMMEEASSVGFDYGEDD